MKNIPKVLSYIILSLIVIFIIGCTVGISHKIIINDYSYNDTLYNKTNKHYSIKIINYPVDSATIITPPKTK